MGPEMAYLPCGVLRPGCGRNRGLLAAGYLALAVLSRYRIHRFRSTALTGPNKTGPDLSVPSRALDLSPECGIEPVNTSRLSAFERTALASSLLTEEQLEKAWAALMEPKIAAIPRDTSLSVGERLANTLVQMGLLNTWQAKQLLAGRTRFNLGPYCIVDSIGSGGMGQVFKAEHGVMGRVVAVKVLPRNKCTPEAIDNFTREIRSQAKLDHPNLVRALDAGHDGKVYYLVTEYVPGADLHKLVRRSGPLSMESAASILSQAAAGLQHAPRTRFDSPRCQTEQRVGYSGRACEALRPGACRAGVRR